MRAYVWVQIGVNELSYCGSCGTRYWTRLQEAGHVIDLRHMITST